jgi:hypothetical protein
MTNKEAIELLKRATMFEPTLENRDYPEAFDLAIKALEERPQGEWIYGEDDCGQDGWFCSECGFFVPWYYQYYEKDIDFIREYKACPHCLAEMVTYTGKDEDTKGGVE